MYLGVCGRALHGPGFRPKPSPAHGPGRVTTSGLTLGLVGPGLSFDWAGPGLGSIVGNVSGHGPTLDGPGSNCVIRKKIMNNSIKIKRC